MTFEQSARDMLFQRGMFNEQINAVIEAVKAAPENEAMRDRWSDNVDGYPPPMKNILWLTVKSHAAEYIEKQCPQAWFKPLFIDEAVESK